MRKFSLILFAVIIAAFSFPEKKKIKIFIAGDSTASIKETKSFPENGWGMPFVFFWDSTVTVVNKAKNGRSTSSCANIRTSSIRSITSTVRTTVNAYTYYVCMALLAACPMAAVTVATKISMPYEAS